MTEQPLDKVPGQAHAQDSVLKSLLRRLLQTVKAMHGAAMRQLAAELDWLRQRYPDAQRHEDHDSPRREEDR